MTEPTSSPDMVEGCHVFPPSRMVEYIKRGRTIVRGCRVLHSLTSSLKLDRSPVGSWCAVD